MTSKIEYFDIEQGKLTQEQVFGARVLRWLYESRSGSLLGQLLTHTIPCTIYGWTKNRKASAKEIPSFIKDYGVNAKDFNSIEKFNSFNDYFARTFLPGKREWSSDQSVLPAFCEGRYLVSKAKDKVNLKGSRISPLDLIGEEYGEEYKDATAIICRLAPVDYHWFHFPDDGEVLDSFEIKGSLNSVSPIALRNKVDVLNTNKRVVNILNCKNLGEVAYVEIGAFCVGTIIQKWKNSEFKRGEAKGHFLFGGSTVVMLVKNKNIEFNKYLSDYSSKGIESYFKLGSEVGRVKS
ncbi:MAG: hypothetical protein BM556_02360 [Bacteriovorax sp. MedPE-SWde]|nr:MAG: hypothetical protein BM556_02360 [Bacteriovorax sp. MedPE-SWde]